MDFEVFVGSLTNNHDSFNAAAKVDSEAAPYHEESSIDAAKVVAIVITEAWLTTHQLLQKFIR